MVIIFQQHTNLCFIVSEETRKEGGVIWKPLQRDHPDEHSDTRVKKASLKPSTNSPSMW